MRKATTVVSAASASPVAKVTTDLELVTPPIRLQPSMHRRSRGRP